MALRASLGADFTEFTTAIKSVEIKIKEVGGSASKVERNFNDMVASMRGDKIKQQADLVVAAFDRMGKEGFSAVNLTDAEARRFNKTMEEAIAKSRAMGEGVPAAYQKVYNETKRAADATESWTASIAKNAGGYLAGMATWSTAQRVIGGTVDFLKESVQAAADAEAAQKRLETAMRQNGVATEGNRQAFAALAAEMQRTTVYEDDQIVALEAMATQLGVLPSQMEPAIKAAANLASGLGVDLETAMKMIVKANNESFTAFQKLGISIDETRAKTEGMPYIFERINASIGGQAAAEVETYAGQIKQLTNEWGQLKEAIGGVVINLNTSTGAFRTAIDLVRGLNAATSDWHLALVAISSTFSAGTGPFGMTKVFKDLVALGEASTKVKTAAKDITDGMAAYRKASEDAAKHAASYVEKIKQEAERDFAAAGRAAKQAADNFRKVQAELREIELGGRGGAGAVWEFGRRLDEAGDTAATAKAWDDLAQKLYDIEVGAKGAAVEVWKFGRVIDEAGETKKVVDDMGKAAEESAKKAEKGWGMAADVLNELSRAAEMAGNKVAATVMSIGAAVAQAAPGGPWAMLAAGGMAVFSALSDKLFKTEGRKVNDLRDAYIAAAGGLAALNAKAHAAGMTLDGLLKAKTVKDYEAAVKQLNTALEKTAQLQGELAGLQQQLADRQTMDWKRAEELITKYGGTLGNLGKQFTDAKTAANWKDIWDDWQTLIDMGADVGGVLWSMKDEIGKLVGESMRIGTEIPLQFKPLIEELIRTGQLFDENGEAITDISQLKFGAPLVSEVDKIIKKIDELITALTTGLTGAFQQVGDTRVPPIRIPYRYEAENAPPDNVEPNVPEYAAGSLITRPHLAMVGEGGEPELIGPIGFMREALTGALRSVSVPSADDGRMADLLRQVAASLTEVTQRQDAPPAQPIAITIQAMDPTGLKQVVEREIAPLLVSAYRRNVDGLRTSTRRELVE